MNEEQVALLERLQKKLALELSGELRMEAEVWMDFAIEFNPLDIYGEFVRQLTRDGRYKEFLKHLDIEESE